MKYYFLLLVYFDCGLIQNAPSDPSTLQPHKIFNDFTPKNKFCKHEVMVSLDNFMALRITTEIHLWCVRDGCCTLHSLGREVLYFMWMTLLHEKVSD